MEGRILPRTEWEYEEGGRGNVIIHTMKILYSDQ